MELFYFRPRVFLSGFCCTEYLSYNKIRTMSNLKSLYLSLSILLLGLFLFFIPQVSRADMSVGFLSHNPPLLIIIIFMGVWIIETLTIKERLKGSPQKALFTGLIVNLVTTLLGFLIALSIKSSIIEDILPYEYIISIPIFFLGSIIIETIILHFYYREDNWTRKVSTSFLMNIKSYLFLLIFLFLDLMVIGAFLVILIVPYFFLKSFELLSAGKEVSKFHRKVAIPLIIVLSLVLCGLIFFGVMKRMEKYSVRNRARDARIVADVQQIRSSAELILYDDPTTGYTNLCDGNGGLNTKHINYGKQLETLKNDLLTMMLPEGNIACYSNTSTYCVSASLRYGDRGYYCVDSSGFAKETNKPCTSSSKCPD